MNARHISAGSPIFTSRATRVVSAGAALLVSALTIASQFGLADHYAASADTALAAARAARHAQASSAAAGLPRQRKS